MTVRIGIDLGTTNTVIAKEASALTVPSESATVVPSVVAYLPNGSVAVGTAARQRRALDARNTIYSSKRVIGRRFAAKETKDFCHRYPFEVADRDELPVFVTRAGERSPTDIAAEILGHLFAELAGQLKPASSEIILAVPADFSPAHRDATSAAARKAGAVNVSLIEEPLATARAFKDRGQLPSGPVAVFDLGGGTFELAVVDGSGDNEILGTASDLYLGGDDIDRGLAELVADIVLKASRWDLRDDPIVHDRLVLAAERAKCELSVAGTSVVDLTAIDSALPGDDREITISRAQLESVLGPIVRRTFVLCDEALAAAGVSSSELSGVLLAGGSSQLPLVGEMVGQYFGATPAHATNPMELVAIGASVA